MGSRQDNHIRNHLASDISHFTLSKDSEVIGEMKAAMCPVCKKIFTARTKKQAEAEVATHKETHK